MKGDIVNYQTAIQCAADLVSERGENIEYDRAIFELMASLFPHVDLGLDVRAVDMEYAVRRFNGC